MSHIKEWDDQCNLNDKPTTKIIETSWCQNLSEVIKFEEWREQIRDFRIKREKAFQRRE